MLGWLALLIVLDWPSFVTLRTMRHLFCIWYSLYICLFFIYMISVIFIFCHPVLFLWYLLSLYSATQCYLYDICYLVILPPSVIYITARISVTLLFIHTVIFYYCAWRILFIITIYIVTSRLFHYCYHTMRAKSSFFMWIILFCAVICMIMTTCVHYLCTHVVNH